MPRVISVLISWVFLLAAFNSQASFPKRAQGSHDLVAQYLYDPYGTMLAMRGPLAEANAYRFTSKRFIASAGIYCFGYRFYDPNLQRWLNPDPIGEQGGLNLYGYGLNNPISLTDPLGLDPSLAKLFFQNLYNNGLSDARRVNDHLMNLIGNAAEGAVKTAYKAVTDPGGLAYDIYEGAQNLGTKWGTIWGDPCLRKRAWEDFKNHMVTPEGIGDALFFVESILAGGLFAPEGGAARIGAAAEKAAAKGTVVLDADPIISAIAQGRAAAVDAAIAGRTPVVPITAAKQVITGQGANALREFLVARGGRIGLAGSETTAEQLRALGPTLNPVRKLGVADSRIAASALREGAPVLTNDKRFSRFLQAIGQAVEGY